MTERYEYDIKYNSGIRDWSGKLDFDYVPTPQHLIKFGAEYVFHTFIPETVSLITATMEYGGEPVNSKMDLSNTDSYTGHDFSVYAEDDFSIGDHLTDDSDSERQIHALQEDHALYRYGVSG